jgi:competence ComEA-like helix-hairpin-helix protein
MFQQPFVFPHSILLLLTVWLAFATNAEAKKKPPVRPINLNTASATELEQVPGIGPSTAGKIVQMRKSYGAFKSVDDLLAIKGIGKKRLDKMRKYVTVGKAAPKSATGQKAVQPNLRLFQKQARKALLQRGSLRKSSYRNCVVRAGVARFRGTCSAMRMP